MSAELPLTLVSGQARTLVSAAASVASPFTGTQQVQDWGGTWWQYEIEFSAMQGPNGARLSAFLAALRGQVGTFTYRDPFIENPGALGTPLVNGAAQTGNSLVTDGWSGRPMRAGDFFSLGAGAAIRLYQLTADVSPSGGNATLQFVPALRSSPPDNDPLNVVNPGVLLRATGPVSTQIGLADVYRFSLSAREAL